MDINAYPDEKEWVLAKLDEDPGSFVDAFCHACLNADEDNYEMLRPLLAVVIGKYPLRRTSG